MYFIHFFLWFFMIFFWNSHFLELNFIFKQLLLSFIEIFWSSISFNRNFNIHQLNHVSTHWTNHSISKKCIGDMKTGQVDGTLDMMISWSVLYNIFVFDVFIVDLEKDLEKLSLLFSKEIYNFSTRNKKYSHLIKMSE